MPDAAMYRAKAAEMRKRANSAHDPVAHQELLSLAVKYVTLARSAELLAHETQNHSDPDSDRSKACNHSLPSRPHSGASG